MIIYRTEKIPAGRIWQAMGPPVWYACCTITPSYSEGFINSSMTASISYLYFVILISKPSTEKEICSARSRSSPSPDSDDESERWWKTFISLQPRRRQRSKSRWQAYSFSSFFISDVTSQSQKDHKLFSATYILCRKKNWQLKDWLFLIKLAGFFIKNKFI